VTLTYIWFHLCYLRSQVERDNLNRPKSIDLFCGIGGMGLAFESAGAECVFSSDWDKYAPQKYAANFGHAAAGNIREIQASDISDHDILIASFPCQPLSTSGVSKKKSLGRSEMNWSRLPSASSHGSALLYLVPGTWCWLLAVS